MKSLDRRSSWLGCESVRHHTCDCSFELKMMAERQIKVIRVLPPIRGSSIRKSPSNAAASSYTYTHDGQKRQQWQNRAQRNQKSRQFSCRMRQTTAWHTLRKNNTETELQWESHKPWQSAKYGNNAKAIGARWSRSGDRIPNEKNPTLPYLSLAIARTEDRAFNMIGM